MRLIVAAVLLGAAVLKAHELVTRPVLNEDLLSYRWSLSLQVLFELGLGLALALGVFRRFIWATTVASFIFFCLITIYKGLSGEASCGCFGVVQVNPWYTLILDVAIVVLSLVFRPSLDRPATTLDGRGHRRRLAVGVILFLVAGIPLSIAMFGYEPSRLDTSGDIVGDQQFVVLEPETWVGQRLPLARHIDSGDQLMTGRWTVVLFSHDCPGCEELVPQLVNRLKDDAMAKAMGRLALIELPPYGPVEEKKKPGATYGKLSDQQDWFVGTPVVLLLNDGLVIAAKESTTEVPEFLTAKPDEGDFEPIESEPGDSAPPITMIVPVAIDHGIVAHDFGAVAPESVHKVTFDVRNTTEAAIGIRKVTSECTCMTADVAQDEISPGETIRVVVTFAAPKKPQAYDKRLLLFTTRRRPSKLILRIKARVGSPPAAG